MQTVLDAHASLNPKPIAKLSKDHHCGRPDALHVGFLVRVSLSQTAFATFATESIAAITS
jgi:hypothetical protein